jgi:hypothetical protein
MSNARNVARILANSNGELSPASYPIITGNKVSSVMNYSALPSGSALQIKSTLYQWYNSMTINNGGWSNISGLSVSITPKFANSLFKIDVRWFGEVTTATDVVFGITRNGTLINLPTQEGTRNLALGVPVQTYIEPNDDSTPEFCMYSTIDYPATTSTITYQAVTKAWDSRTMWTGRMFNATATGSYEQGSTEIIVTEYAG